MSALNDTTFFVATSSGTSSRPLPRRELIRRLTSRQIRWSQLVWCQTEERWKPARDFQKLMGAAPMMPQIPDVAAVDSTNGEAPPIQSPRPSRILPSPSFRPTSPAKVLPLPACAPLPAQPKAWAAAKARLADGYLALLARFARTPLLILLSAFFTIYLLPLKVRATLAESGGKCPPVIWEAVKTMIFHRGGSMTHPVTLRDGTEVSTSLVLPRPMRVRGTLELETPLGQTVLLLIRGYCGTDGQTPFVSQVVEIHGGAKSAPILTTVAPQGRFRLTAACQDGAPDQPISASLTLATDY
jgi:hypothetical protein